MKIGDAFVVAAIEVVDRRYAQLHGGIANRIEYGPRDSRCFDAKPALGPVVLARAQKMILDALEQR